MPQEQTQPKKKKSGHMTKVQVFALWFLLTATVSFWSGVIAGQYQLTESNKAIEAAKIEAVSEYKTQLK